MKLRIKGNSIRLRLGRSEVAQLIAQGVVAETTTFDLGGHQRLDYRLIATTEVTSIVASCDGAGIIVRIPVAVAHAWGTAGQIGIEATQPAADGGNLRILIEKDLECLDAPVEESQADAWPRGEAEVACPPQPRTATVVGDKSAR